MGGTVGPLEVPLPTPNVPDYASQTKTLRNYPTPRALFLSLGCKAVVQALAGESGRNWTQLL